MRIATCFLIAALGAAVPSVTPASTGSPAAETPAQANTRPVFYAPSAAEEALAPSVGVKVQVLIPVSKEEAGKFPRCSATVRVNCVRALSPDESNR